MSEQESDPLVDFAMGDCSCDACVHAKVTCMWPTTGSLRQVCFGCQRSHGKCEIGGKPVTARGPHKKCRVVSRATIEGDEEDAEWVPPLPAPKVAGTVESPFTRALVGVVKEMKASRKSSERIAQETLEVSRAMLSQTVTRRAGVDRARSSGRSGSEFGRTWLQRAGRCADSAFVSRLQSR